MRKRLTGRLSAILSPEDAAPIYDSYDIIGNIEILRLTDNSRRHGKKIARTVTDAHNNVKTVLTQTSGVSGEFRLARAESGIPFGRVVRSTGPNWCQTVLDIIARPDRQLVQ